MSKNNGPKQPLGEVRWDWLFKLPHWDEETASGDFFYLIEVYSLQLLIGILASLVVGSVVSTAIYLSRQPFLNLLWTVAGYGFGALSAGRMYPKTAVSGQEWKEILLYIVCCGWIGCGLAVFLLWQILP